MAAAGIYTMGGAFWEFGQPDWDHTKMFMLFGVAEDHDSNPIKMGLGKLKKRGAKVVGVNPITDDTTLETWTTSCIFAVDVASLFNFENLKKIKLIVVVRDVSLVFPGTLQSESAIVEINVLNVNEPPWFTGSKNYAFDVNEEMPIENLITLMDTFSDVDEDNQGNAVFQIENITQNQNQGQIN